MTERFQRELLERILASEPRIRRRRRNRRILAAAAAVVVASSVAAAGLIATDSEPVEADVVVSVHDGLVQVSLTDLTHMSPGAVASGLAKAGLRAQVEGRPVGPSNVGRFVDIATVGKGIAIGHLDVEGSAFRTFTLPRGWTGELEIGVGVRARPGETYAVSSEAFADDEPLDCSDLLGRALSDATRELSGIAVRVATDAAPTPVALADADPTLSSWKIDSAEAFGPHDVLVHLVEPTTEVAPEQSC
jgi:hypothetical protein